MRTFADWAPTPFDPAGGTLPDKQDWLTGPTRTRDSNTLDESNFHATLDQLGGESRTVEIHRFGHWACGWCEVIMVAPNSDAARTLEKIANQLSRYPVLDERDYSARREEAFRDSWRNWGERDFVEGLALKLSLDEETQDALTDLYGEVRLRTFFLDLCPNGDEHLDEDGPTIGPAIQAATLDDVQAFLRESSTA